MSGAPVTDSKVRPLFIVDTKHGVLASTSGLVILNAEQAAALLLAMDMAHEGPVENWAPWLREKGVGGYEKQRRHLVEAIKRLEAAR